MSPQTENSARTDAPAPQRRPGAGWLLGILCGVLAGLWAFPPVRYTLGAQMQFALVQDSFPWLRALDSRRSDREVPRLNAVAALAPDDYLLQIGRATALADIGVREENARPAPPSDSELAPYNDRTLIRLGLIARDFPAAPGAYAHLARYLMVERVRILRVEMNTPAPASRPAGQRSASLTLDAPAVQIMEASSSPTTISRSIPAPRQDVRLMEWAIRSGQVLDEENAFWSAMLAATYFAAMRDKEALDALARAARQKRWDAYLYEEILGQWRLYSAAYGDNGAAQKIGPLSLLSFPHLRELRYMAEMARWHADRAAREGRAEEAIRIRRNLGWLGILLRDSAQWAYEALYGTDLFFISSTDSDARFAPSMIRNVQQWERSAVGYLHLLNQENRTQERARLRSEAEISSGLRERVDVARYDASYPGIPPGIPLMPLFGDWMAGYCLLQQALAFGVAALLVSVLAWHRARGRPLLRVVGWLVLVGALFGSLSELFGGVPSARAALALLAAVTCLFVLFAQAFRRDKPNLAAVLSRWKPGTTGRMLLFTLFPGLVALYFLRPHLSSAHPVATLLASLMGSGRERTAVEAIQMALLTFGFPLLAAVAIALWAIYRRVSPVESVLFGLRRLALPAVACLLLTYFAILNQTLRLDAAASQAINMAARNDLQWVLTHSGGVAENE
jgi:hypothetical protein